MRTFKHVVSGETLKVEQGLPQLAILESSPSWEEIKQPASKGATTSKKEAAKK